MNYFGITRYKNVDIQSNLYLQVKIGKLDENNDNKLKFTYYCKHEIQQEWNCSKNIQFYTQLLIDWNKTSDHKFEDL